MSYTIIFPKDLLAMRDGTKTRLAILGSSGPTPVDVTCAKDSRNAYLTVDILQRETPTIPPRPVTVPTVPLAEPPPESRPLLSDGPAPEKYHYRRGDGAKPPYVTMTPELRKRLSDMMDTYGAAEVSKDLDISDTTLRWLRDGITNRISKAAAERIV